MEEKKEYKITLDEFWNKGREGTLYELWKGERGVYLGIHCDTEEKAKTLLTAFDKMGQTWRTGVGYTERAYWKIYTTDTVYYNDCSYGNLDWAKEENCPVYEFEEVDLEKYLDNDNETEQEKGE